MPFDPSPALLDQKDQYFGVSSVLSTQITAGATAAKTIEWKGDICEYF